MTGVRQSRLLPILRSETQARLLAALLLDPKRETSLADLAHETESDPGNLQREAERLVGAGILIDRRVGRTRLLRDARGDLSRPLADLLLPIYGPKPLLERALTGLTGIDSAWLFGSWAARYRGIAGPPPADIDLLIVGSPDRGEVDDAATALGARLRRDIQTTFRSLASWRADPPDPFVATLRTSPLVRLIMDGAA